MEGLRFLRWVHGALFGLVVAGSVLDIGGLSFIGPTLAAGLSFSLVGLILGVAFVRQGRPGGRALLLAADGGIVIVSLNAVAFALTERPEPSTPIAVVLAVAGAASLVVVLLSRVPVGAARVVRSGRHRFWLLAIAALGVINTVAPAFTSGVLSGSFVLVLIGGYVPPLLMGIAAWWWGSGWLLALIGLSTLMTLADYAIATIDPRVVLTTSGLLGLVSIVAGLRPPRLVSNLTVDAATDAPTPDLGVPPAHDLGPLAHDPGAEPASIRPTAAAVWALLGGALLLPSVYLGRFPPALIDCFDCPAPSPLAGPSIRVDVVVALLVPLAAVVLAAAPRSRPVANGSVMFVGLVGVALILAQIALGFAGIPPFTFMPAAAPASMLVGTAFLTAIVRPHGLAGTGRVAALAAGLAALVWMFVGIQGGGPIDLPLAKVTSLVTGGILLVALARDAGAGREMPAVIVQLPIPIPGRASMDP